MRARRRADCGGLADRHLSGGDVEVTRKTPAESPGITGGLSAPLGAGVPIAERRWRKPGAPLHRVGTLAGCPDLGGDVGHRNIRGHEV